MAYVFISIFNTITATFLSAGILFLVKFFEFQTRRKKKSYDVNIIYSNPPKSKINASAKHFGFQANSQIYLKSIFLIRDMMSSYGEIREIRPHFFFFGSIKPTVCLIARGIRINLHANSTFAFANSCECLVLSICKKICVAQSLICQHIRPQINAPSLIVCFFFYFINDKIKRTNMCRFFWFFLHCYCVWKKKDRKTLPINICIDFHIRCQHTENFSY